MNFGIELSTTGAACVGPAPPSITGRRTQHPSPTSDSDLEEWVTVVKVVPILPAGMTQPNCGTALVRVRVPAILSATGRSYEAAKPIDACLADIVAALVAAGIYTSNCCCGHGKATGSIILTDGRHLEITFPEDWKAHKQTRIECLTYALAGVRLDERIAHADKVRKANEWLEEELALTQAPGCDKIGLTGNTITRPCSRGN